jgi:hypothetical protein
MVLPKPKRKLPYTVSVRVLNVVLLLLFVVCSFQFRPVSIGALILFRPPTENEAATEPPKQILAVDKKKGLALNLVRSTAKKQLELIADASAPLSLSSDPVPIDFRGPPSLHKIPHQLIFTFKYNLLERQEPLALYQNLQRTIQIYREGWGEPEAPVWFLNDTDCRSAIHAVKPELLTDFDFEPNGSWKADMCRIAALYLTGGYYFDVDMEVVEAFRPSRDTTFVTVEAGQTFFQSFLASDPKNRILGQALDEMLVYYPSL